MNLMLRALFTSMVIVCANAQAGTLTATFTDAAGALVPDAVVFATPIKAPQSVARPKPGVIDQINKEFVPMVSVVQTGAAVSFPNKDNIRHHVYSFSAPKPFDLKLYSGVPSSPVVFDKPGVVILGCNIHDWMVAYLLVVDTPYFAKSEAKGTARIDTLPPGEYEVRAWHPKMKSTFPLQKVVISGDADSPIRFRLELAQAPGPMK